MRSFFALSSDFDLTTVAAHWDSISLAYNRGQQAIILRLFDGRISKPFLEKIKQSEQQQLMGPCRNLWFPDPTDQATLVNNSKPVNHSLIAPWFHLSKQHEIWLAGDDDNATLRYNVSLYLWENHGTTLSQYSLSTVEQIIDLGLKKAQSLGFTLTSTICQCFSLFLDFSPIFYRYKEIQSLWTQPASEQDQLILLSEKITLSQWQHIAQQAVIDDWQDIPENPIALTPQS